jgi:hypothetical protein
VSTQAQASLVRSSGMPNKTAPAFAGIMNVPSLARGEKDSDFAEVQDYLQRFGYVRRHAFTGGLLDDPTSEGLARFQEFFGLPVTGEFDDATRARMTTHRCGMPDLADGAAFVTRCSWPHPGLTYAFETGTNDVGGSSEFQAVRNAFFSWSSAVPLSFVETSADQNPDILIDWRPATDPDLSMVGGVLAHADFPPACGVVTNTLPKPVHFDDSEHQWVIGAVAGGFDVQTIALHEIGHILGLQHSTVAGSVMFPSVAPNSTNQALTADDLGGIRQLYPTRLLASGTYTIRQKVNGRHLDAHEIADQDFRLVTRTAQDNATQRWLLDEVGVVYTFRQKSSGRFLDAHEDEAHDFGLVTRTSQDNDTQRWVVLPSVSDSFRIRQLSNGRFVDAHEIEDKDFRLVTRTSQDNDTQRWLMTITGTTFTLQQRSNSRFVDAHEIADKDFAVVSRTAQGNDTQKWILCRVGAVYTIRQESSGRFVDAYEESANDFAVVTRTAQDNDSQRWVVLPAGNGSFTVQQLVTRRYLDAYEESGHDFGAVTRTAQNNDTQRWLFDAV